MSAQKSSKKVPKRPVAFHYDDDDGFEEFEEREVDKVVSSITDRHNNYAQFVRDLERVRNRIREDWEAKKERELEKP